MNSECWLSVCLFDDVEMLHPLCGIFCICCVFINTDALHYPGIAQYMVRYQICFIQYCTTYAHRYQNKNAIYFEFV